MTGTSLWLRTAQPTTWPSLHGEHHADVAVIGGGIVGVTTAFLLAERGRSVALLDAGKVASGVTGHTTAKVTVGHGLKYATLTERHGESTAKAYADANQQALIWMRRTVHGFGINCDWTEADNTIWAESGTQSEWLAHEADAARSAGLAVSQTGQDGVPFDVTSALVYRDQAHFHPHRYLTGLLHAAPQGVRVFEHSPVHSVTPKAPHHVATDAGVVSADHVVVATHFPILDRGMAFALVHPYREYVITGRARTPVHGMHVSAGSPTRSVRPAWDGDTQLVVVSGEKHRTGEGGDTAERYARLEAWAVQRLGMSEIRDRWSSQDCYPVDDLPLIGPMEQRDPTLLTATGFAAWGMTGGTMAARILADRITDVANPFASVFDPSRGAATNAPAGTVEENVPAGIHMVTDHAKAWSTSPEELEPGEGRLASRGVTPVAAYRDDDGTLHEVSARCTHLGCLVAFNTAERTWDCPCHGSRFATDGSVLHGPATEPLDPPDPSEGV